MPIEKVIFGRNITLKFRAGVNKIEAYLFAKSVEGVDYDLLKYDLLL